VAAAPWNDPEMTLKPNKYRILFNGFDYYPQFTWAVGVTTREFAARSDDFALEVLNAVEQTQAQPVAEVRR